MGLSKLFVLTTRSIHWFQERGFTPVDIDSLPESKKEMYNYQRRSKVLMADLDNSHPLLLERAFTRQIQISRLIRFCARYGWQSPDSTRAHPHTATEAGAHG